MDSKQSIREILVAKRLEVTPEEVMYASEEICHRLWDLIQNLNARTVALYIPMHNEVDLSMLGDRLEAHDITICLPRVVGEGKSMVFNEWLPSEDMLETDARNIPCVDGELVEPDLVVMPVVSFDNNGGRIGYGAGFYDRTLPRIPKAVRVGAAYAFQEVGDVFAEDHDVPLHYVCTDAELVEAK